MVALEALSNRIGMLMGEADAAADRQMLLVLEHRLAILRADIDFLTGYVRALATGEAATQLSGSLEEGSIAEPMLGIAAARRTGIFRVRTPEGQVAWCFDQGQVYGILPSPGKTAEESLRLAFRATRGTYSFEPSEIIEASTEPVGSLVDSILVGAREMTNALLLARMQPSPETLLDVSEGYEHAILGCDLTERERRILSEIDGVRSLHEIVRCLGWPLDEARTTAYPLWLAGWVVRTGRSKRQFVLAASAYVGRWFEAAEMFGGTQAVKSVEQDMSTALQATGILDFHGLDRRLDRTRVALSENEIADHARGYIELLERSVAARLGGVADDIRRGYAGQMPPEDLQRLRERGVLASS